MKKKPIKSRNVFALHALQRKAGIIKDRREPKSGANNDQELLDDCLGCDNKPQKYEDGLCEECHKYVLILSED